MFNSLTVKFSLSNFPRCFREHKKHMKQRKNKSLGWLPYHPLKTHMTMEHHHFLIGDTSSNVFLLNCHVSFPGISFPGLVTLFFYGKRSKSEVDG